MKVNTYATVVRRANSISNINQQDNYRALVEKQIQLGPNDWPNTGVLHEGKPLRHCSTKVEPNQQHQSTRQLQSSRRETNPIRTKRLTKVLGAAKKTTLSRNLSNRTTNKRKEIIKAFILIHNIYR